MDQLEPTALTTFSRGAGCGCKLSSAELNAAISAMSVVFPTSADVLVASGSGDDAGVVRLSANQALVQTLDFFTPIVDDAYTWGRIAATNALSDVYAMGGTPVTAMNIVGWPRDVLPWALLAQVLDGAATAVAEADCVLVGGHSIDDAEPKFGLSVTGLVHPDRVLTNAAGQPGDNLILTKPLGVGIVTTAVKRGVAPDDAEQVAVEWMTESNRRASEAAVSAGVRCATDVTGFGLMGHLREVLSASDVNAEINLESIPVISRVRDLVAAGAVPGGTQRNLDDTSHVEWGDVLREDQVILCDAQTSGGLLLAVSDEAADTLLASLENRAWTIGRLTTRPEADDSRSRVTFA